MINGAELKKAFSAFARPSRIPILNSIWFGNNLATMTDLNVTVSIPVDYHGGHCLIPLKLVGRLKSFEIEMADGSEGKGPLLRVGTKQVEVNESFPLEEWPEVIHCDLSGVGAFDLNVAHLRHCLNFISSNETRPALGHVRLARGEGMVACCGYLLLWFKRDFSFGETDSLPCWSELLIPDRLASVLCRLVKKDEVVQGWAERADEEKPWKITFSDGWFFVTGHAGDMEYPDFKRIVPDFDKMQKVQVDTGKFLAMVREVDALLPGRYQPRVNLIHDATSGTLRFHAHSFDDNLTVTDKINCNGFPFGPSGFQASLMAEVEKVYKALGSSGTVYREKALGPLCFDLPGDCVCLVTPLLNE